MTTQERFDALPRQVLQFHATEDTLTPIGLPTRPVANFVEDSRIDIA